MDSAVELNPQEPEPISPLVDPFSIGIGEMLDNDPPARRWIIPDLLPLGIAGVLASGGGTGKSFLTVQLGIAATTGRSFLGMPIEEPGGVLILAAEDEREELHRRLSRIVRRMLDDDDLGDADLELMRERLFLASRVGEDNRLTAEYDREIIRTGNGDRIAALVEQLPPINLIVIDPVSRFRGGDENANDAATRFVEAVEALRAATGATILMPHHVSKSGIMAGADALSVEMLRGASALVDGVRWAAAMATLRKDAAADYGVEPDQANRYVRFDAVKSNYGPPWPGMWLERTAGGVLVPCALELKKQKAKRSRAETVHKDVIERLRGLIRQRGPMSANAIETKYGGEAAVLRAGQKAVRAAIHRAVAEGELVERPNGRGSLIHVPD